MERSLRKYKWLWVSILCLVFIFNISFSFGENSIPSPTKEFYTGDFAKLLSNDTKQFIVNTNLNYEKTKESPQVVVVTVPNLNGMDIQDYAVKLLEKWKIGNKKYDNGVLLLLSVEDRKVWIEVGYGLEGAIPDGRAGEILDQVTKDLSAENYNEGLGKAFYLICQDVNKEYNYSEEIFGGYENRDISDEETTNIKISPILKAIGLFIILFLIWIDYRFLGGFFMGLLFRMFLFGGRGGGGGSSGGGGRSGGGGAGRGF